MKLIIMVLLITTLCACVAASSGNKGFLKDIGNQWVGHPVDDLIIANGQPDDITTAIGGGRVFEYSNPVDTKTSARPSSVKDFFGDPRGQRLREKRKKLDSDQFKDCKILFNVSATDIIESWSAENCG